MHFSTRFALFLGLQFVAGAAFIACGSDGGSGDDPSASGGGTDAGTNGAADNGGLAFVSAPLYSAYVTGHEAQVPVVIKDASRRGKGATFTSSDTSIATVSNTTEGALVTVKKDGKVVIKGALEGDTGSVLLTIKPYTEAQWAVGQARYSKSELAIIAPSGTALNPRLLVDPAARNANGACNTCHTQQAQTLKIENGPTQIAGYSDDELVTIFTMGMKPEGATVKTMIPAFIWGEFHEWTVTDDEKVGLIAFLRTQTPKANGVIDYGVRPCSGDGGLASAGPGNLCDNNGNPIQGPGGGRGRDGGRPASSDAGTTTTTSDAGTGTTTSTSDAGSTAGDAG